MKIIVAGGRDFWKYDIIVGAIQKYTEDSDWELVCGMAPGVDTVAYDYAEMNGIPIHKFYADWDRFGNSAGHIRNEEMAKFADALIAVWDGKSPGTKNMIERAIDHGLMIRIVDYNGNRINY